MFDIVSLLTTRNVTGISTDNIKTLSPHGPWTVVMVKENQLLLCKDLDLIRIPTSDVKLICKYGINSISEALNRIPLHVKREEREEGTAQWG